MVGDPPQKRVTITVTGNSLHFHRDTNFWFETTITLPAGKDPKQLHATIKGCPPSQADSVGQVVRAFFKIEDGTLTLATIGDDAEETPKGFEAAGTRYELRKVQSPKKDPQPHKPDEIGNAYESAPATLAASRNGDRHIADGRSACEDLLTRLSVQIWGPIENPV